MVKKMHKQNNEIRWVVSEWDMFDFMQKFSLFLCDFADKNDGFHPEAEERDAWMVKWLKRNFKKRAFNYTDGMEGNVDLKQLLMSPRK